MYTVIFLQKNKPDGLFQTIDKFEENEFACSFFMTFTTWTLISGPGTRFPRAVVEPSRLAPVGSPLDAISPQESRTFLYNQLRYKKLR